MRNGSYRQLAWPPFMANPPRSVNYKRVIKLMCMYVCAVRVCSAMLPAQPLLFSSVLRFSVFAFTQSEVI